MRRFLMAMTVVPALCGVAGAGPAVLPTPDAGGPYILQAGGCHADVRRHYVPEYGRPVTHYHDRRCLPVRAGDAPVLRDCHRDVRQHRIRGELVWHRHVGPNCAVRIVTHSN